MNKERLLQVADAIERSSDVMFNMSQLISERPCGTAACIAGFALIQAVGVETIILMDKGGTRAADGTNLYNLFTYPSDLFRSAQDWLELTSAEASALFMPYGYYDDDALIHSGEPLKYPPELAVKVIRHFAETGEVDWEFA